MENFTEKEEQAIKSCRFPKKGKTGKPCSDAEAPPGFVRFIAVSEATRSATSFRPTGGDDKKGDGKIES